MTAYKCDRCGALMETPFGVKRQDELITLTFPPPAYAPFPYGRRLDFCRPCAQTLSDVLNYMEKRS